MLGSAPRGFFFVLLGGNSNFLGLIFPGRFWIRGEGEKKSKNFGKRGERGLGRAKAWKEERGGFWGENTGLLSRPSSRQHLAHNLSQKTLLPEKNLCREEQVPTSSLSTGTCPC